MIQTIYYISLAIIAVAGWLTTYFQRNLIAAYKNYIKELHKKNDDVLIFCLQKILEDCLKPGIEDYENAIKIKLMIDYLTKEKIKNN